LLLFSAATNTTPTASLPSVTSSGAIVTSAVAVTVGNSIATVSSVPLLVDSGLPKFDANSVLSLLSSLKSQTVESTESLTMTACHPAPPAEQTTQVDKNLLLATENLKSESTAAPAAGFSWSTDAVKQNSVTSPPYQTTFVNEAVKRDSCLMPAFETSLLSAPLELDSVVKSVAQVPDVFGTGKQHDALSDFGISAKFVAVKPENVGSAYSSSKLNDAERVAVTSPAYAASPLAMEPSVMTPVYMTSEPQQSDSALSPTYMDADDDAGGLTPVLDEKPETTEIPISPPPASSVASFLSAARPAAATEASVTAPTTRVTDPIAFLNQMLSQSKPKQSGSSASFLQSLSLLTKSIPSNKPSGADSDSDETNDDVYIGGYLDREETAVDSNKLKTQPATFGSWTADDELRPPPLPRSPSPILPPPPLPHMVISSAASPPELPPPPLPPSLCTVASFLGITPCTPALITSQALPPLRASASTATPSPSLSTQLTPGLTPSARVMPSALQSVIQPLTLQTDPSAPVRYADSPTEQTSAPRPPPPPPPAYPLSGPRQDWCGMSPRMDSVAAPVDGRPVGIDSQVVVSPSAYQRHQGQGIGVCDEPRYVSVDRDQRSSNVDFSGPAGDTREFAERLKRRTAMQFSPGTGRERAHETLEPFHSANASAAYADRHAPVYNTDYSRCDSLTADDASMFKSGGSQISNVRPP
jgi:hypothetical protein